MTRNLILASSLASWLVVAPAQAAVTLTYEHTVSAEAGGTAPPPSTDTITIDGQKLRAEQTRGMGGRAPAAAGPMVVIFDGAAKKVVFVSPEKKTYSELTEADIKGLRDRMQAMRGQMGESLKALPPEQRARMERMMSGEGPDLKFTSKGQKKTINGFACEMYDVTMDGRPFQETCIAPWGTGPFTKADADSAKAVFASLASLMKGMPGAGVQHMASYPGVPVHTKHLGGMGAPGGGFEQTLKSVSRSAVAASQFQIPAGYTKEPLPMMGGAGAGGPGMGHGMGAGPGMGHGMGPGGPPAKGNPHGGPPGHAGH